MERTRRIRRISDKNGQAWGFDLMVASVIFIGGIVLFYIYSLNYPTQGEDIVESLFYEGNLIADTILSEGHPENWEVGTVIRVGILSDHKINRTKLEFFYNLTNETITPGGYAQTKALFNTRYDYFFNSSTQLNLTSGVLVEGIGRPPTNPENLIVVTRLSVYENTPITTEVFIWE